ncbi:short-chain fatty acid transporter [Robertkochia aurantiaca]|uniref:short-chain fatty acid transporter n=1 Tax=Robertkochia aurantiaca TaxID=2873700 RepID=UPI001CCE3869|nr:TIGR00366 family protein [Robertkochia sp. 3YJGBD-33]
MIERIGNLFTDIYRKSMPDAFVFALLLTIITAVAALWAMPVDMIDILKGWYDGFWLLLEFGMQMVLLVITGYSIALSPFLSQQIDRLGRAVSKPWQVYLFVTLSGTLLCMVSWGWIIIPAVIGRELALRVKGVHYPYLIACVYCSFIGWVTGLSSSIPLLLNTEGNFIIEAGILEETVDTGLTLGSGLNLVMIILIVLLTPAIMFLLRPRQSRGKELPELLDKRQGALKETSIREEADAMSMPEPVFSDRLNNSILLQALIALAGLSYISWHFYNRGADLNLNIMIFIFLMLGMLLHQTPLRYGIAMKRASSNVSAILFQFPFYAGIMGIMINTGLADRFAQLLATFASQENFAGYAFVTGGLVNFAIPSAGGEFAVIGPSILNAVKAMAEAQGGPSANAMIARSAMAIAYGESLSNLLQPFFLLLVIPVMAKGISIQARDIMGYLIVPFLLFFIIQFSLVMFWPL